MTGAPKGKRRDEGAGCHNNGNCDTCPYTDCVATAYECTNFYKREELNARSRWSLAAIRGTLDLAKEERQRLAHNAKCMERYHQKRKAKQ